MKYFRLIIFILLNIILLSVLYSSPTIPGVAWSRDIAASGYKDGAPIGGFGAGTITWKLDGNFYLSRLDIGNGDDNGSFTASDANAGFYFYQKSASGSAITRKLNAETLGSGQARYYSLFPFAWVDYYGSQFNVKAKVTQFSPLIPNDYQRVSYPLGIYEWELTNPTSDTYDAAVMLTFNNPYGASATLVSSGNFIGIVLNKSGTGTPTLETQGEFCLASISSGSVTVSRMSASTLSTIVNDFSSDGVLSNTVGSNTLGAIAFKVTLSQGQSVRIPIVLAWDIPIAQAGSGQKWYRKYTKHFNRNGTNSWAIAQEALTNHSTWESQLDNWQNEILNNPYYPSWLKSMLFNELYIYFTGGTYWEDGSASGYPDNANENMFSHLESYIYDFYGTSDVRFYGSWALFLNWPDIDKQCVKQFCDSVYHNRTDRPAYLNTTAHDFGNRNTVFTQWNAYTYRDSTNWKDLNSKLVLMVYRDWHLTGRTDTAFLNYCWEPVKRAMAKVKSQDTDGDGLPNSNGIDQTYDDMDLTGDTAYCGGLFLAACLAAKEIALAMGDTAQAATYQSWFDLARPNFESQLWTGQYYRIDTESHDPNRIMSDQLCGQWYAKALELPDIVVNTRAISAFQKIYDNNFSLFGNGSHGVVNVMNSNGTIDTSSPQTQECWVGTSWGVVAGMVHHGMTAQANAIGQSLYNTIWNTAQYWFRTPEAWRVNVTSPRAFYYMRASAIWAVKRAYDRLPYLCTPGTCTPPPTPTFTRTPTPTATINPCAASYLRVNCGGPAVTDSQGLSWAADQAYTTGGWGYMSGSAETIVSNPIANTQDDVLYQSGRWGSNLEYRFTLSNKAWRVKLKFAEIYSPFTNPGQRVFNVFIEGNQVLSSFDIVAAAGGQYTAVDYTFDVNLTDGILNITTTNITDNPKFSAIEILDPSVLCTATATRTGTPPTSTRTITMTQTRTITPYYSATSTGTNTPYLSPTITITRTISPTPTITPSITPIRVNCGGPQYNDGINIWLADQAYVTGGWGYVNAGAVGTTADAINGTTLDTLYQSERYATNLEYRFTIPNGQYQVNLKFVEMYWTANGSRVFSVALEGTTVITNLDIYATVGHDYAYDRSFIVTVSDGILNIVLTSTVDNAQICAIEILP
ncbi:MAG: GH116 family glycosyl hydrolase, partial [Candidatus Goldbacteria bacterium]|nr:GH116 family glycosyl hydrolase [Candidatus Goldiibacteriota bacterium]